jgi:DNA-binding NtrC family response regulator
VGERQEPKAGVAAEQTTGLDPITGIGRGVSALVIGKSDGERESVARALHRAHRDADGPFLKVQGTQEEGLLKQALESWMQGSSKGESPRLLDRLEGGSLFLDQIEALGLETQRLLLEFLEAEDAGASPTTQPWKGQLITGSGRSLRGAVKEGRFDENLALRLERVRIVLDPEQAGPDR